LRSLGQRLQGLRGTQHQQRQRRQVHAPQRVGCHERDRQQQDSPRTNPPQTVTKRHPQASNQPQSPLESTELAVPHSDPFDVFARATKHEYVGQTLQAICDVNLERGPHRNLLPANRARQQFAEQRDTEGQREEHAHGGHSKAGVKPP
jgi:hypothetical protein